MSQAVQYLAMSKAGWIVAAFDTEEAGMAFVIEKRRQKVRLQLFRETTTLEPCSTVRKLRAA